MNVGLTGAAYTTERDTGEDGYHGLAPVDAFGRQNKYGFYNLLGNAWEWTADDYQPGPHEVRCRIDGFAVLIFSRLACCWFSLSPQPPSEEQKKVLRGGSYLDTVDGKFNHIVRVTTR